MRFLRSSRKKTDRTDLWAGYENLVRQIAGTELQTQTGDTLQATVERTRKRTEIEKKIVALEAKIRKEKQLNRQMELNAEVKKLKKELEKH